MPQSICNSCLEKLAICYLYRELCFDTQIRLQQLYESQKQTLSYIDTPNENAPYISSIDNPHNIDSKNMDYVSYTTVKTQLEYTTEKVNTGYTGITSHSELSQDFEPNETLEQSCDFEYLGCDNQNSYDESHDKKDRSLKEDDDVDFGCVLCSKRFKSKYSLNRHSKTHVDGEELKCHICLKKFTR